MEQKVVQKAPEQAKKPAPNLTGIPTQMKLDFERRSGLSFDDVRVHYNSDKPRKIGALAYTQIPQVHIGPGQERHLRHELGHVVQQKQGIVRPTTWINGVPVNDSPELESAADSLQYYSFMPVTTAHSHAIVQGYFEIDYSADKNWFSPAVSRPNQQSLVKKTFEKKTGSKSKAICHIISDKFIRQALMITLLSKLNEDNYLPTYDMKAPKENRQMTELRTLVKAVIPSELNLSEECTKLRDYLMRFSLSEFYESSLKQRQNALSLVDGIDKLFGVRPKVINPLELSAKTSALYDILSNAIGNLKIGHISLNSSVNSQIDPVSSALELVDGEGAKKTIKIVGNHPYNMESKVINLASLIKSLETSRRASEGLAELTGLLSFTYKICTEPQSKVSDHLRSKKDQQPKVQVRIPQVHYLSSDFADPKASTISWDNKDPRVTKVPFDQIKVDSQRKQHHTLPELKAILKTMQDMTTEVQSAKNNVEWVSIEVRNATNLEALTKANSDVQLAKSEVQKTLSIVKRNENSLAVIFSQLKNRLTDIEKAYQAPGDVKREDNLALEMANCKVQMVRVMQLLTNANHLADLLNQFDKDLDTASSEATSKLRSLDLNARASKRARPESKMGASTNATSL